MSDESVRVNFAKPFPVFPLRDVVLLPHAVISLFIFERRYRQMIEHSLDTSGQLALAVYSGKEYADDYEGTPAIKPAVCLGQLVQHHHNPDGTYTILVQGICRARISEEHTPDADRLYRTALLTPLDSHDEQPDDLELLQHRVTHLLAEGQLAELDPVRKLREQLEDRDEPLDPPVFFDLMALSLFSLVDAESLRYTLLAEPNPTSRARFIERELANLNRTVTAADRQFDPDAPPGVSWN